MPYRVHVKLIAGAVQQFYIVPQGLTVAFADECGEAAVIQIRLDDGDLLLAVCCVADSLESQNLFSAAVIYPLKFLTAADGPVDRVGLNAKLVFNFIKQVVWAAGLTVHFIDKGEDRNIAEQAYLEQLTGLRLNAFRGINNHHRGVRGHQRAIGILRKILMPGGIENIDAVAVILKLHDRGGNGDPALLFNFHPVGNSMPCVFLPLYRAG